MKTGYSKFGKRLFDIVLASLFLVVFSPIFLVIYTLMLLAYPGPAIYRGKRVGLHQKEFEILKFRTMVIDAEERGGSCTTSKDPRVTSFGRILRKTKLDELPQLWNILRGDMSFVGSRPDTVHYVSKIDKGDREQIFSLRPGLTDEATLENLDEENVLAGKDNPEKYYLEVTLPWKVKKQLEYVSNISFILDLKIILRTIYSIFTK